MRKTLPPALLIISLVLIYSLTLAPGLTWANAGADGGDFITAAATGGIPHPTGYPVYLLLAKLFQALPLGPLAFRTNLLSMLAAVLAVLLVYGILVWMPNSPVSGNWVAGLIAGYAFGLSPLFWSQAVITEVYTLQAFFAALAILLALWIPTLTLRLPLERWRGLVLGLAVGNHLTSIFLIPPVLLVSSWQGHWKLDWRSLFRISAWLGAGLLAYLLLPIWALSNPPVNWGNPVTFRQFVWLVTGEFYQRNFQIITSAGLLERVQAWATLLLQQFELPGLLLALVGLIYYFKPSRLYFITLWNAIFFSCFAILYGSFDSYVYLLPVFLSFALWIGLGIGGLLQGAGKHPRRLQIATLVIFFCLFAALTFARWPKADAAHDLRAEQFGARAMEGLPWGAIVFADGDRAIFALWYFHFALKQRPDLVIVVPKLIQADWYQETLRETYPALHWPDNILWAPSIAEANPARPVCYLSYVTEEELSCQATR